RLPHDEATYSELHGSRDTAAFERRLKSGIARHHGHLLPAWLNKLTAERPEFEARLERDLPFLAAKIGELLQASGSGLSAWIPQIARQFALVGIAGEVAVERGLLPWGRGAAREAAQEMARWVCTGSPETAGALPGAQRVIAHILQNRQRIVLMHPSQPAAVGPDVFGWQDEHYLYVDGASLRGFCADREVLTDLTDRRLLVPGNEARSRQYKITKARFEDRQDRRVYRFDRVKLDAEMTRAEMD
ncbi:hypothetical protein FJY63_11785, partial [Candidatus Sumerlaeota bacterium]|nr:hypothetical protein [Candidatus Sumerlaeota bacterium]